MKVSVCSRVSYDSLKTISLVNSKGNVYKVAFNAATRFENGNIQFTLFHRKRTFRVVQNWIYDPVQHHLSRTVCHNKS